MIKRIFNHSTKNITRASFILATLNFLAKILGLLRNLTLREVFGIGETLDLYFTAFRLPDLVYTIFIVGGTSVSLIPIFASLYAKSKEKAFDLVNNLIFSFLLILSVISIFLFIFAPQIMRIFAPGFKGESFSTLVFLTRVMLLSPIILGISNVLGSVLQYFSQFLAFGLAPIFYNLGIIFGALFLTKIFAEKALAFGVILGAILHLLVQIPGAIFSGLKPKFILNFKDKNLKNVFKLMIPRNLSLVLGEINLIFLTAVGSLIPRGSITIFNFANDIRYFPVYLFGISFATASFPYFSKKVAKNQEDKFKEKFFSTFNQSLFLLLPISFLFFLLRAQIIRVIYGADILGKNPLSWSETRLLAATFGILSLSIFPQGLLYLLSRAFFAKKDTITPLKITSLSFILMVISVFIFLHYLSFENPFSLLLAKILKIQGLAIQVLALPLAVSLGTFFSFFFFVFELRKKIKFSFKKEIYFPFLRILSLTCLVSIFCWCLLQIFAPIFGNLKTFWGIFGQLFCASILTAIFYLLLAAIFKFKEFRELREAFGINLPKYEKF